jgi:YWFCY motif protein/type IV secretory system conjugative DNA transfer VirD4/TraG family protein
MQTGENEQALRKIVDMTRLISIVVLLLHFYFYCYEAFKEWNLTSSIAERILVSFTRTGLFANFHISKIVALGMLGVSLIAARGKKSDKLNYRTALAYSLTGLLVYFSSCLALDGSLGVATAAELYMGLTAAGYLLVLAGVTLFSRILHFRTHKDVFNAQNETFPQEERLLENEFSINLPAQYSLKGEIRPSWINFINPHRGLLVLGSPGSGKSYFIIHHIIRLGLAKGNSMFVYDFKYDDLSIIVYNHFLKNKDKFKVPPAFYVLNFDDLSRCHRCNPLHPSGMTDLMDAIESSRAILLGLNREWIRKQGDFFVESPINLVAAIIWFLRKYKDGKYCTLPHVIELLKTEYEKLFAILLTEKEVEVLVDPFSSAFKTKVFEQLEGQVAGAKIGIGRLSSPTLYYVLSGNDFTLDINNPKSPKVVCAANNPQKQEIYGAVLSLFVSRLTRLINTRDRLKSSLIFDEFPTIFFNGIENLIATARSNKVATTIAVQDYSQLKNQYSKEQAEVIFNIAGNVISGQVSGETAKLLSERFGKIMQDRESVSINSTDTSLSKSTQLEQAIPASKIANLSSGEFVGTVADNPDCKISLKNFHCQIINDHAALKKERDSYQPIPMFKRVDDKQVLECFHAIKNDATEIVEDVMEQIMNDPFLAHLIPKSLRA